MFDLSAYAEVYHICDTNGYITWRYGTGMNVELLHIRSAVPGGGTALCIGMLRQLLARPPYATVFGFTRTCNHSAQRFYEKFGFTLTPVVGVYADGDAVLFSASYTALCKLHGVC
jgi:hypothetical protein